MASADLLFHSCLKINTTTYMLITSFLLSPWLTILPSQVLHNYTGTIRENRMQNCLWMAKKDIAKKTGGECDYRQDVTNDLVVVKWHDNAVVSIVSNCHGIEPLRSAARWSAKEKRQVTVTDPDVVHQ